MKLFEIILILRQGKKNESWVHIPLVKYDPLSGLKDLKTDLTFNHGWGTWSGSRFANISHIWPEVHFPNSVNTPGNRSANTLLKSKGH